MPAAIDISDQVFGKLTVLGRGVPQYIGKTNYVKARRWICRCACGRITQVETNRLRSGHTKSCGCGNRNGRRAIVRLDGEMSARCCWESMRARCYYKNDANYARYGGRGIQVCDRWRYSFSNFFSDMGKRPSRDHSLDRIDCNKGYTPDNCRWATCKEQQNNRRSNRKITVDGVTLNITQMAEKYGVPASRIFCRLARGWSADSAVKIPPFKNHNSCRLSETEIQEFLSKCEKAKSEGKLNELRRMYGLSSSMAWLYRNGYKRKADGPVPDRKSLT